MLELGACKPNSLRHLNAKTVDLYKTVLEAAWEDSVNASEFRLLERLRLKLEITRRDHRIIELQLGKLPSERGALHTAKEVNEANGHLERMGLVLRARLKDEHIYCVPDELAIPLRQLLKIELQTPAYLNLLKNVQVSTMKSALEASNQLFTGAREFLASRLIDSYKSPKAVLKLVEDDQLRAWARNLSLPNSDSSKDALIRRIVSFTIRRPLRRSGKVFRGRSNWWGST